MTDDPIKPPRKTGLAHLIAATGYSLAGFKRLLHESAFRQELLLIAIFCVILIIAGASFGQMAGFGILALLLFAVEALNSALEELVDHISPDWAIFAKNAKDLGSFAVMCLLLANALYVGWVLLS